MDELIASMSSHRRASERSPSILTAGRVTPPPGISSSWGQVSLATDRDAIVSLQKGVACPAFTHLSIASASLGIAADSTSQPSAVTRTMSSMRTPSPSAAM